MTAVHAMTGTRCDLHLACAAGTYDSTPAPFTLIMQTVRLIAPFLSERRSLRAPSATWCTTCGKQSALMPGSVWLTAGLQGVSLLAQDCNLVLYNANYIQTGQVGESAVWSSVTYDLGTQCTANVTSAGGGSLTVNSNTGVQLFKRP